MYDLAISYSPLPRTFSPHLLNWLSLHADNIRYKAIKQMNFVLMFIEISVLLEAFMDRPGFEYPNFYKSDTNQKQFSKAN